MVLGIMKRLLVILILLLPAAGCQQPAEVELRPDLDDVLEVTPLAEVDSTFGRPSIDSSAVLPREHDMFGGMLVVNRVKYDAGVRVDSGAFSRVYFANRNLPVMFMGRIVGFHGIDLGLPPLSPALNGAPMSRVPHRIPLRRIFADSIALAGFEYFSDLTTTFQANTEFRWTASSGFPGGFDISIRSTDNLEVQSPRGGSLISRNQDLPLRWRGQGDSFTIVISRFDPLTRRVKPLLQLRPRVNRGHAIIPAKILRTLPRERFYVMTFMLANRSRSEVVAGYGERVLVQAASVYNSYVEIR